nr:immunoglobulin heavy chain junction region [Macaca mulatta]
CARSVGWGFYFDYW